MSEALMIVLSEIFLKGKLRRLGNGPIIVFFLRSRSICQSNITAACTA